MGGLVSLLATPGRDDDWRDVVDLYEPTLRRVIIRRTADRNLVDDVLQETYARAWRARVSGRHEGMPDARWMSLLATRASIDLYRRQPQGEKLDPAALVGEWLTADRATAPGSDEHLDALVSRQALRWAFRRLTPRQRRLLVLRGVRNLTYREIAEREGISENAVASALNRARERLRVKLLDFAEGRTGARAGLLVAGGLVQRVRVRMARLQSTSGARVGELVGTTAALGIAVAMTAVSPVPDDGATSSVRVTNGVVDVIALVATTAEPAEIVDGRDGTRPRPTPGLPSRAASTGAAASTPGPLRTATTLDVGAEEMTFRLDVAVDLPGIDDRSSVWVEVYCTRSALLRPACPTLDSLEPRR